MTAHTKTILATAAATLLLTLHPAGAAPFSGAYTVTRYQDPGHVAQTPLCITFTPANVISGFPNSGTIIVTGIGSGAYAVNRGELGFFTNDGISINTSGGEIEVIATTTEYHAAVKTVLAGRYVTTQSVTSTVSPLPGIAPTVLGEIMMTPGCPSTARRH